MKKEANQHKQGLGKRISSGLMAAAMLLGMLPQPLVFAEEMASSAIEATYETASLNQVAEVAEEQEASSDEIIMPEVTGHWSDAYVEKMVEYGYLRPEESTNPDSLLTRAEFSAIVNRAYNYTDLGDGLANYSDVSTLDWFYDDISIATTAGYITGTSDTTIEPYGTLTRETTAFILGKNMMLPDLYGENLVFTDTREISSWSRAMVKATSDYGLMAGYDDGSFRPQNKITVGEVSTLVVKAIGTPILEGGEVSLGEVMGNVTITESGTFLKNTVIAGDLYISNGIGLGSVNLENVTVLGRIVISGGESEDGDASILLRNVVASELVIDNMDDQYVSVRVDGNSYIEETFVRTNAYIEDTTTTENGMREIYIDAEAGTLIDLAGRIKTVTNNSAGTTVRVTTGTVDVMNIGETATEVVTEVMNSGEILQLNIDVATNVIGDGDVKSVSVNASDVVITMLPDEIEIRPGIEANIFGEDMDHLTAEEYSTEPMILSGYPKALDIAPTTMDAVFATNKTGTLYWGISYITQGSISGDDLISPPSYGNTILQYGSMAITSSDDEFTAPISELYIGGDYYLSAVFVDARGDRSPVKVVAFSTPDDSIPAFVSPYPYVIASNESADLVVMPSKDCKLYYVVLTKGAVAPTPEDFMSGSLSGAWGVPGIQSISKNKSDTFTMSGLEELSDYDVYMWLTDADHMHYSDVTMLTFTTTDGTPPWFDVTLTVGNRAETSADFTFNMNEDGTMYWVAVPEGSNYPTPQPPNTEGALTEPLTTAYAQMSVANAYVSIAGAFSGNVAAKAGENIAFTITGLAEETAYDLYYVGKDLAGNYSTPVEVLTFNTKDQTPPTFLRQEFSDTSNTDEDTIPQPYSYTDITLIFSEGMQSRTAGLSFLAMYNAVQSATTDEAASAARNTLAAAMADCFEFYTYAGTRETLAVVRSEINEDESNLDWVIDYRWVEISLEEGEMHFKFPTKVDNMGISALNLDTGAKYGFKLLNLRDSSYDANTMLPSTYTCDTFTTVYAEIQLGTRYINPDNAPYSRLSMFETVDGTAGYYEPGKDYTYLYGDNQSVSLQVGDPKPNQTATIDAVLVLTPSDMSNVDDDIVFDIRLEPNYFVGFDVYMRLVDLDGKPVTDTSLYPATPSLTQINNTTTRGELLSVVKNTFVPDENGWIYLSADNVHAASVNNPYPMVISGGSGGVGNGIGVGLSYYLMGYHTTSDYMHMNQLTSDYEIELCFEVTKFMDETDKDRWNGTLDIQTEIWAGIQPDVAGVGTGDSDILDFGDLSLVSLPTEYYVSKNFSDSSAPGFATGAPQVVVSDISAELQLNLEDGRTGTIYYAVLESGNPYGFDTNWATAENLTDPSSLSVVSVDVPDIDSRLYALNPTPWPTPNWGKLLNSPSVNSIQNHITGKNANSGEISAGLDMVKIDLSGLAPLTEYYVYLVTQSSGGTYSQVYLARFTTLETERPKYTLKATDEANMNVTTHVNAESDYVMLTYTALKNATSSSGTNGLSYLLENFTDVLSTGNTTILKTGSTTEYYTFKDYWTLSGYGVTYKDSMTVLEAMSFTYSTSGIGTVPLNSEWGNGYTLFDVFADDTLKNEVYRLIANASGANSTVAKDQDFGTKPSTATLVERNNLDNMNSDQEYVFLIAGLNVDADNSLAAAMVRSFAALTGFRVNNTNYPKITSIQTTSTGSSAVEAQAYEGSVTVTFDQNIYAQASGATGVVSYILVEDGEGAYTNTQPSAFDDRTVVLTKIYLPSDKDKIYPGVWGQPETAVNQLIFDFTDLENGSYVDLFDGNYVSNYGGYSRGGQLRISFHVDRTEVYTFAEDGTTIISTKYTDVLSWTSNWDDDDKPVINSVTKTLTTTSSASSGTTGGSSPVASVSSVSILSEDNVANSYEILLGEELTLEATWEGNSVSEKATWGGSTASSKLSVQETTDTTRTFVGKVAGEYEVTATVDGVQGKYTIKVKNPTVSLVNHNETVTSGDYGSVTATISNVADPSLLTVTMTSTKTSGNTTLYFSPGASSTGRATSYTVPTFKKIAENTYEATIYYNASSTAKGTLTCTVAGYATDSTSYEFVSSGGTSVSGS